MMVGVFVYSFLIGTFSNIFTKMDNMTEKMKKNLQLLKHFAQKYNIGKDLYHKTRKIIKVGYELQTSDYNEFLNGLTTDLKVEVGFQIYNSVVDQIDYFKEKPHEFIVEIGPHLKPLIVQKGEFVFSKDDIAEESKSF
jgi:hypothetical protein